MRERSTPLEHVSDNKSKKKDWDKRPEKKPPKKITPTYLHNSGLYYLERFAASKNHFKTVMKRKVRRSCMHHLDQDYDECAKMVDELADKFEKVELLNDAQYTESHVNSMRRRGMSRSAIITKLMLKGIPREQTSTALDVLDEDLHEDKYIAEKHAAVKLVRKKKIGPFWRGIEEENHKNSLGKLARAGFSYEISSWALKLEEEELDEFTITRF